MQLTHSAYRKIKPKKLNKVEELAKILVAKWRLKDEQVAEKEVEKLLKIINKNI